MLLKDKIAIMTGAASFRGIGWATAKRFAEEGARVAILDLDAGAAQQAAEEIGWQHCGYACDVRSAEACQAAVGQIIADFGQVDILVNNAGVSQTFGLMDSSEADYDIVMDVSMRGAYNMSRAVVPHLRSRKTGSIVCMGSLAAQLRRARWTPLRGCEGGGTGAGQGHGARACTGWHSRQRHRPGTRRYRTARREDQRRRQAEGR